MGVGWGGMVGWGGVRVGCGVGCDGVIWDNVGWSVVWWEGIGSVFGRGMSRIGVERKGGGGAG